MYNNGIIKLNAKSQSVIVWFIYFSIMLNFYTYTYIQLFGQMLLIAYIMILIMKNGVPNRTIKILIGYIAWYGGLVTWAYLSRIWAVYSERADASTLLTMLRIGVIGICLLYYMSIVDGVNIVIKALIFAGVAFSVLTVLINPISVWGKEEFVSFGDGFMRNGIASICLMLICFTVFWKFLFNKYIFCIMISIFSITLFLCGSRRSILMLLSFVLLYNLTEKSSNLRIKRLCIFGLVGMIFLAVLVNIPYIYNTYIVRIEQMFMGSSSSDASTVGRLAYIELGWKMVLQRPILGWGTDAFYTSLLRGNVRVGNAILYAVYSHNNYIEILTSYGFVGAVLFYRFHIEALIKSIKKRKSNQTSRFLFIMMIIWLVSDYGGIVFSVHMQMYFLIISFFIFKRFIDSNQRKELIKLVDYGL